MTSKQRSIIGSILIIVCTLCTAFILTRTTRSMDWLDLTDNNRYSLTDGTDKVLAKVRRPLKATLYYSKAAVSKVKTGQLLRFNRAYFYTRDLLAAYERLGKGKIEFIEVDPKPFTNEADDALDLGIRSFDLPGDQLFFFGLAVTSDTGAKEVMPFINAGEENLFEYKITKMIERVARPSKNKLGIMSPLPVAGDGMSPEMRRLRQAQGMPAGQGQPWNIIQWLESDYEVTTVDAAATSIPADIDMLLLVHPKGLQDTALYAIDQFVLRGGNLIALVDPHCDMDQPPPNPRNPYAGMSHPRSSDVNRLSAQWGFRMVTGNIVGDRRIAFLAQGRIPLLQGLHFKQGAKSFNSNSVITEPLSAQETSQMLLLSAGSLETLPDLKDISVVPLLQTSETGGLRKYDGMTAMMAGREPGKLWSAPGPGNPDGFVVAGKRLACAVVATGKFKSAFPDGLPGGTEAEGEEKKDQPAHIKEASESNAVVVIADVDFVGNNFVQAPNTFFGGQFANKTLLLNALDFLGGSGDLMGIRSRGSARREFTYIQKIEREAANATQDKSAAINAEIQRFQSELNSLNDAATQKNKGVMQSEMYKKQREAQKKVNQKQRELREVQREARENVDSVKASAEFINTLGMPLLVALIGLILWILSITKRSQKMREDMA